MKARNGLHVLQIRSDPTDFQKSRHEALERPRRAGRRHAFFGSLDYYAKGCTARQNTHLKIVYLQSTSQPWCQLANSTQNVNFRTPGHP